MVSEKVGLFAPRLKYCVRLSLMKLGTRLAQNIKMYMYMFNDGSGFVSNALEEVLFLLVISNSHITVSSNSLFLVN